jgi:N-acetylglucosaminyldiphosphoundecaprenol N-acetyl-beta-D-mannosaminyltransferase
MKKQRISSEAKGKIDRKRLEILGVSIDSISKERVLNQVREIVAKKRKLFITTPNPEIVLEASHDIGLRTAINGSDIAIADGTGIIFAGKYLFPNIPLSRIKGRELFIDLIQLANQYSWKVVLIGNSKGSAEDASVYLSQQYKKAKLYSVEGPNLTKDGNPFKKDDIDKEKAAIELINEIKPELVFVAFGAPRQEKWLYKWKSTLHGNVFMVVGGAFDSVSGKVLLPPSFWPQSLEWLFRLITQPTRFRRIYNALIVFPFLVYKEKHKVTHK